VSQKFEIHFSVEALLVCCLHFAAIPQALTNVTNWKNNSGQ
jgi:hypothetical protein